MPSTTCHSAKPQAVDLVFQDTTVYAAIVELLLELEGVDPEPEFWARSSRGPWRRRQSQGLALLVCRE